MPALPEPAISKQGVGRIMTRRAGHAAARVRPGAAEVEAFERHSVIGCADHWTSAEQLVEPHLAVENVAADEAEAPFKVERRMDLSPKHGLGEAWRMRVDGRDNPVGRLVALSVPTPPRPEIVAEVLAEQARDMLALGCESRIESRRDQHLDDWLFGPAVHRGVEIRVMHIIEARRHDDAGRQMI